MRDCEHIGRRMLKMELSHRRQRRRSKRRFMDVLKKDVQIIGVRKEAAEDRER